MEEYNDLIKKIIVGQLIFFYSIIYLILYIKVYLNLSTSIPKFGLFFFKD